MRSSASADPVHSCGAPQPCVEGEHNPSVLAQPSTVKLRSHSESPGPKPQRLSRASNGQDNSSSRHGAQPQGATGSNKPVPATRINDLPDLTQHLQSLGLYAEYQRFRDGYMKWRQGGTQGARGEASAQQFATNEQREFQEWCPPYTVWRWRRTISYWVTVTFFEGALLFTISSTFACVPWATQHKVSRALIVWPNLIGGLFFMMGAYFMCLEVVNLRNHGAVDLWPLARRDTLERLAAVKVSKKPYYAALTYFIGCFVYNTPLVVAMFDVELSPACTIVLVKMPYLIGGLLFVLGGIFECLENEVFTTKPDSMSKWSALSNGTGGTFFFVAAAVNFWSDWWCSLLFAIGSAIYAAGAVWGIFMWRDEQFGLAFLVALNSAARKSRASGEVNQFGSSLGDRHGQQFSARSTFFILFFCMVAVLVVYNAGLTLQKAEGTHGWRFSNVYNEALPFFLMHMVLLMHSAVVQTPSRDNQPFHTLVMTTRVLAVTTGVNAFSTFTCWLPDIIQAFKDASAAHDPVVPSPPDMPQRLVGFSATIIT